MKQYTPGSIFGRGRHFVRAVLCITKACTGLPAYLTDPVTPEEKIDAIIEQIPDE